MITVNEQEILFEQNMTVADALRAAGEAIDDMTLVMMDGKVLPCGQDHLEPLEDGAHIKLLPFLSGG